MHRRTTGRRAAAAIGRAAGLVTLVAALAVAVDDFPRGLLTR